MRTLVRTVVLVVALALVAASCGGSDDEASPDPAPTAETAEPTPTSASTAGPTPTVGPTPPPAPGALPAVALPALDGDDEPVGFDPDVRTGTLDNGLTYYIRRNTAPGSRAELRLAIDAGSALQDDDQSGVAHFLEHMLFNGTERYPANELVAVLEAFGSEFGPDVNAYTSIDETVYELSVPTDDRALFVEAFDVLAEWASKATIDPDEVIAERGVVLEEWRLRDQGLGGRIGDLYSDLLTPGTPYEDRLPIGTSDAIATMTPELVQRFYDDWYRPDLMAVVAVGDFAVDDVEALIRARFADLTGPDDPRPVPAIELPDADQFAYARLADPEMPSAFIEVFYEGQAEAITTIGDYRRAIGYSLAADILGNRFADDVSRGDAPYISASPSAVGLARDLDAPSFEISGPPEVLEESLGLVLTELERLRRDGIEVAEFDRAVAAYRSIIEQRYAGRDTTQDVDYAGEYVDHFLGDVVSISWEDFRATESRLLDEMTPDYVVAAFLARLGGRAPQVVVVGPEDESDRLPSETDVRALIDRIAGGDVAPRFDDSRDIDALMTPPDPAPVIETFFDDQLGSKVLRFDNGVTVALKPTTIAENLFSIGGVNPGGTSVLAEDELAVAFIAADVVSSSGVGDLDQVELDRLLADRVAFAAVTLEETSERIDAGGGSEDAELVLQLVHQYLTAPRAQPSALTTAVTELEPFAADPGALPFLATSVALLDARYGDGPRYRLLPEPEALAAITAPDIERVYRSLLGDASGSVFAIVGDFDPGEMEELAARYLGTLPADGTPDDFVDHQPPPPAGVVTREVRVGRDPQAEVTILVTAELETDLVTEIELAVVENVLSTRLRDRLREALGATYSPVVAVGATETPDPLVETFIQISADPDRVVEVAAEAEAVLADLRSGGLTEQALATGREQVRRDFELVSNLFWVEQMLYAETHPDVTMLTVRERIDTAAGLGLGDANALLDRMLPADRYIVITMVPEA